MAYTVALPDGRTVEFPDDMPTDKAAGIIRQQFPDLAPKTTAFGHAKELFKGIVPGAVGMLETAATGAASMLPEKMEKSVRGKVADVAASAKAPFAAAPGYEESVTRKIGEGIGSTAPFFALGPLGMAGRAAGAGLGVAAGAGEAREAAEAKGATESERRTATVLGAPTGLLDMLAPQLGPLKKVLGKELGPIQSMMSTAVARGGIEGATEAAQKISQNLIAKGVYDPKQEILAGSGEEGAYGAGIGALTSLILDMTLPGRGRVRTTPPAPTAQAPAAEPSQPLPPAPSGQQALPAPAKQELLAAPQPTAEQPAEQPALPRPAEQPALPRPAEQAALPKPEAPVAEPRPDALTMQNLQDTGVTMGPGVKTWAAENLVNKTKEEVQALVDKDPTLIEGKTQRAKLLRELLAQQPAKFEESTNVTPPAQTPTTQPPNEPRGSQPSVGVPSEPAASVVPEPGAGTPGTSAAPAAPVGRGLVSTGQPAGEGNAPEGTQSSAINPESLKKLLGVFGKAKPKAAPEAQPEAQPEAAVTAAPEGQPATVTSGEIQDQIRVLEDQAFSLLDKAGREPRAGTAKATQRAELLGRIDELRVQFDTVDRAERTATTQNAPKTPPPKTGKSTAKATTAKKPKTETTTQAADTVEDKELQARLQAIIDDPKSSKASKRTAFAALDALTDPELNETAEDRQGNREYAKKELDAAEKQRRFSASERTAKGQSLDELKAAIASAQGPLGHALRRMVKSGKIKLEEEHPSGKSVGGYYDGSTVTLYAKGIPEGKLMAVALHEIAAHMGMAKLLGKEMYDKIGQQIMGWVETKDGSFAATIAQRAYKRIPLRDMKRGPEVFQDELIAYFVEEMAKTEMNSHLPKVGPIRALWNRIREAFARAIGKELDIDLNPAALTPETIYDMAQATFVEESKTKPAKGKEQALESTAPAFQRWFGNSKVVDKNGDPLVVYRGVIGDKEAALNAEPRAGYAAFGSDSAKVAASYGNPDVEWGETGAILPLYIKADKLIEFPTSKGKFDKFEFDRRAKALRPGEVLVARQVYDYGPRAKVSVDPNRLYSYPSDIYAWGAGTSVKSATGNRGTYDETNPDIRFSVSAGTESLVNSMGPLDAEDASGLSRLIKGVKANPDVEYVTKFRTQVADVAATIEQRLRNKFDGAVRDKLGNLNPMGLYRQAQDYSKMLLEYFQTGTLYKDPVTGLWKSGVGKGVRPPAEIYALIDKYAEKNGYTRERATQIASRVLEGVRLDGMRASNNTGATSFVLHLKDAEIDQLMREYNADPDLKEMSKLMDEARIEMVNNLVKVGRLTKEMGDEWKSVVGYVPFDRIEDFATKYSAAKKISTKGISQLGRLPELIGSDVRPVGNVFDNYINTLGWMVGQTLKTDATRHTLEALKDAGFAKKLGPTTQGHANTVESYIDGEKIYWSVPSKYDVVAFKDLSPPKLGIIRAMGEFSTILRRAVTSLPPFALKQVTDDVQRAILTSGVRNPGALIRMSLTNFGGIAWAELRGIQHPTAKEFGALGLTGEYDFQAGKPAASLLKDLGYKKRGRFETLMHRLDGITRASDLAVRKAIYDQTMLESNNDTLLAQTRAREFINFRRRGASETINVMVTTIPFFNAYIQGMDVVYRAASGIDSSASVDRAQARQMFWSRATTVFMLSSIYALAHSHDDDDEYEEMDLRTRDGNWILPGGVKIAAPGELGALFKVVPERIVEYMRRQGTPEEQTAFEAMRTTLSYMFEQYLGRVTPVPQAIKPVMEAWANKSFLTGRALEGYHHQAMDPSMRVTEQTSELAKAIAKFSRDEIGVETSPIMIDNALRGYFGSSAALLTMTTDSLLNPTRVDRPLHKYALLSNYMYDPVGTRRMTEFYEEREKVGKANTTLNELMKTDLGRAEQYANDHQDELVLEGAVNSTLEQLENTRAYRKFLNSAEGAKAMPVDEREASLKEIKAMEIEFVKWVREAKAELAKVQR